MSLIEAIVTLALLAIVLLALAPLFTQSVNINASSNQTSIANSLAREKLEQLLLYPTTDPRLAVPASAGTRQTYPKTGEPVDLPTYWNPKTGGTSTLTDPSTLGVGWYPYPYRRTYTVEAYGPGLTLNAPPVLVTSTLPGEDERPFYDVPAPLPAYSVPYYEMKLVTVTVEPTSGPFPGLRRTTQSAFVRFRNAQPN